MTARNKSLRVDCLAREIPGRVALIAGGLDGTEDCALQLCKDLHTVLESGEYRLRLETHAPAKRAAGFEGRPMTAKFPGRCHVCGKGIEEGSPILYNGELRRASHQGCGEVDS